MNLDTYRRTAAEIAAAAIFEIFPKVELLGGGETSTGFVYHVLFPHPIHKETLDLVEERMRQIIREKRPIKTLEMVPFSASELLKREGHHQRAGELEGEGLVELIQIGSFTDLCEGPHLKNTSELGAFKILSIEPMEEQVVRITGCVYPSKQELKDFLKRFRDYSEINHLKIGQRIGFWLVVEEGIVWTGKGIKAREKLIEFFKRQLWPREIQEISAPLSAARPELYAAIAEKMKKLPLHIGEIGCWPNDSWEPESGLFENSEETRIQKISYFPPGQIEEETISSLQTIDKTLNILGFKCCIRLAYRKRSEKSFQKFQRVLEKLNWKAEIELRDGPAQLEFLIEDGLGRYWSALQMKGEDVIAINISVEKMFALLLEKNVGAPTWMTHEEKTAENAQRKNEMGLH